MARRNHFYPGLALAFPASLPRWWNPDPCPFRRTLTDSQISARQVAILTNKVHSSALAESACPLSSHAVQKCFPNLPV